MDYLKELMFNKRNQAQKNTYFVILFIWSTKTGCWLLLSGKEITESKLASTSLDVEARGSIELRIDWKKGKKGSQM